MIGLLKDKNVPLSGCLRDVICVPVEVKPIRCGPPVAPPWADLSLDHPRPPRARPEKTVPSGMKFL